MICGLGFIVLILTLKIENIESVTVLVNQRNFTSVFGEPLTMNCTIDDDGDSFLNYGFWIKTKDGKNRTIYSGHPGTEGINRQNPTITITSPTFDDNGIYICGVNWRTTDKDDGGIELFSFSQPVTLAVVGDYPDVDIEHTNYTIKMGEMISLNCIINSLVRLQSVWWIKPNFQNTIELENHVNRSEQTTYSLSIDDANMNDTGQYRCCARNGVGTSCSEATIITVSNGVNVLVGDLNIVAIYGESVTMTCTIDIGINVNVINSFWIKTTMDGRNTTINKRNIGTLDTDMVDLSLVMLTPRTEDSGVYTCCVLWQWIDVGQEERQKLALSDSANLSVIGGIPTLEIHQTYYDIGFGEVTTIECNITSLPKIKELWWMKNGYNFTGFDSDIGSTINSITITKAHFNDSGKYSCCAINAAGRSCSNDITVNVRGDLPRIKIPFQNYQVDIGHRITLVCTVTAVPKIKDIWWNKDDKLTFDHETMADRLSGGSIITPSLTILEAKTNDSGSFICCAKNAVGTSCSNSTFLNVTGDEKAPMVYTQDESIRIEIWAKLSIRCSVINLEGFLAKEVYWLKNSNGVITKITTGLTGIIGSTPTNPSLTIISVTESENGIYTCNAENEYGVGRSQMVNVTIVGDIPYVSITRTHASAVYSSNVTLGCKVISNPPVLIVYWVHSQNGRSQTINHNSVGTKGVSPSRPSLTLTYVTRMDDGSYTCYATNGVGTGKSNSTQLHITGDVPKVTTGLLTAEIHFGKPFVLHCSVESLPNHYNVYWEKNANGRVIRITRQSSGAVIKSLDEPSLHILYATTTDAGQYKCFAENAVGLSYSAPSNITVVGGLPDVSIVSNMYKSIYGNPIVLHCKVTADPHISLIYWTRNISNIISIINHGAVGTQGITIDNASLVIPFPVSADSGTYICRASNIVGTQSSAPITLEVIGTKPLVTTRLSNYKATYQERVTLPCDVKAEPFQTHVYWFKVSFGYKHVIHDKYEGIEGSVPGSPSLIIKTITVPDEGEYICVAVNSVGIGESLPMKVTVDAAVPVLKVESKQLTTGIGFSLTLACSIQSSKPNPTKVYWIRYSNGMNDRISSGSVGYSGATVHNPSLTILYTTESMSGDYKCFASNAIGTGNSLPIVLKVDGSVQTSLQEASEDDSDDFILEAVLGTLGVIIAIASVVISIVALRRDSKKDFTLNGGDNNFDVGNLDGVALYSLQREQDAPKPAMP